MKRFACLLGVVSAASAILAQTPANPTRNVTTLVMGMDISNGIVAPAGPSRVSVPPGERVVMSLPDVPTVPIQWLRNDTPLPGATAAQYTIAYATAADRGLYRVTGFTGSTITTGINLDVVPEGHLGNLSSRVDLTATGSAVVGFVVTGSRTKTLLFRAVGPTLQNFGISSPAPRPWVRCFDARGNPISSVHPAVVIDVNALFQSVGAFPVDASELPSISYDYGPFAPGAYTLVVTDAAKTGGTALVEVYEMGN